MNWNFFKTNWFYLALGLLLLLYAERKYPGLNPFNPHNRIAPGEKITKSKEAQKRGVALLGFVPDTPKSHPAALESIDAVKAETFLKRFAPVAVSERKKFGVPASVILAVAYVNSEAGQRAPAVMANNFFAISSLDNWEGESANLGGERMRKYESAWASFRDFSIHLSSQEWFGSLKKSAGKDGRKWVEKLGAEGFGNTKAMLNVMEAYRLDELD